MVDRRIRYELTVDTAAGRADVRKLTGEMDAMGRQGAEAVKKPTDALGLLKGAVAGVGFAYLTSKAIDFGRDAVAAFRRAEDAAFSLEKAAGKSYGKMVAEARKLSGETRNLFRVDQIEESMSRGIKAMEKYGIGHDQTMQLIRRGAGAAAARNMELGEATERLFAAMRGEAESAETLGLTLSDSYMKNQSFNGSLKTTWEKLTDAEKAAYRYKEMLQQTAHWTDAAAEKGDKLSGELTIMNNEWQDLLAALGEIPAKSEKTQEGLRGINTALHLLTTSIKENKSEIGDFMAELAVAGAKGGASATPFGPLASALPLLDAIAEKLGIIRAESAGLSADAGFAQMKDRAGITDTPTDPKSPPDPPPPVDPKAEDKAIDARKRTFAELQKLTRDATDYAKWSVEQEYADRKKVEGETVTLRKWRTAQLDKIDKDADEKTKKEQKTLHDWLAKADDDEYSRKEQQLIDEYDLMVEQHGDREDLYQAYVDRLATLQKESEEKQTAKTTQETAKREAAYQKFATTFGGLLSGMGGQGAEFWSAFATLGEDAFTGIASSFGVTTEEMTAGVGAAAGVYSAGMAGQQQTAQGNRTGGIIAGAMGGAAAGAQMGFIYGQGYGAAIGAVVGAVAGGALASSAPDPATGKFGEFGLGDHGQIRDNSLGAESRFAPLFAEALSTKRGDVASYIARQMQEIMRGVMDLSDLLPQHQRDWDTLGLSMEYVGDVIDQYGMSSEQAKGAMQMTSDQASTLAMEMILGGQANSAYAKTAVDIAVSLNQEGAVVLQNTTAMQNYLAQLTLVDDRTRGLAMASQSLQLAEQMLAAGTMLSFDQFSRVKQIQEELSAVESRRSEIMRTLTGETGLSEERMAALYAELQALNENAKPLEEELTNLSGATKGVGDGSDESATGLAKVNKATHDLGEGANKLTGKLTTTADGLDRTATTAGAAERMIRGLRDTIDTIHDKTVKLSFETEETPTGPGHYAGLSFVPFDGYPAELHWGERVLRRDEADFYRMIERSMGPDYLQQVSTLPAPVASPSSPASSFAAGSPLTIRVETPIHLDGREIARSVRQVAVADSRNGVPWARQEP